MDRAAPLGDSTAATREGGLDADLTARIARELARLKPTRLTPGQVAWGAGPDPERMWIPEEAVPIWGSAVYDSLTPAQRRRYNQYYALQKSEQFIWLERYLVIRPLERLLAGEVPSRGLRRLLESFVLDERQHNASLKRLVELARPDLYRERTFLLFAPSWRFQAAAAVVAAFPRLLSSWVLLVGALEEHTITLSQLYKQADERVDPVFATVYALHALDEARHCQLDSLVADWLVARQRGLARRINARMLDLAFTVYFDPEWGYDPPIRFLVADFPELGDREPEMIRAAQEARTSDLAGSLVDRAIAPITARNAERYPMLGESLRRQSRGGRG